MPLASYVLSLCLHIGIILIIWLIRRFLKRRKRKRLEREAQEEAERLAALNPETEEKQDDETGI